VIWIGVWAVTTQERLKRVFEHKEGDRIPIFVYPWDETIIRWRSEGLPEDIPFRRYFDIDDKRDFKVNISPDYPREIIEETDEHIIYTTEWGAAFRKWKHASSTPECISYTITNQDKWREAKGRMTPSEDRVDWKALDVMYKEAKNNGYGLEAEIWFGFDSTHSFISGTETILMAMIDDPDWCAEMFNYYLDMEIAHWDMIFDRGYDFDYVSWPDDMGYKNTQFFSLDTYREILKPVHKRAAEWAHSRGKPAQLHSCGYIEPFIKDFTEIGIDGLNPMEVKAGMDPVKIKKEYGKDLFLSGGINAVLWNDIDKLKEEMYRIVPELKQGGGYIFAPDHTLPPHVSLADFTEAIRLAKELGKY